MFLATAGLFDRIEFDVWNQVVLVLQSSYSRASLAHQNFDVICRHLDKLVTNRNGRTSALKHSSFWVQLLNKVQQPQNGSPGLTQSPQDEKELHSSTGIFVTLCLLITTKYFLSLVKFICRTSSALMFKTVYGFTLFLPSPTDTLSIWPWLVPINNTVW